MNYVAKGEIVSISPISEAGSGKKLTFRIDTKEQYNNLIEFELYKGADHVQHLESFNNYNKVGDLVNVEFQLKTYNWKPESENKIFTSLAAWKINKVDQESNDVANHDTGEDLPF